MAGKHLLGLVLPQAAVLDHRADSGLVQHADATRCRRPPCRRPASRCGLRAGWLGLARPGPAATCSRPRWPSSPGRPTPPRAWRPPAGAACSRTTRRSWSPCPRRRVYSFLPPLGCGRPSAISAFAALLVSLRRACKAVESPAVSLPKSGTASPSRWIIASKIRRNSEQVRLLAQARRGTARCSNVLGTSSSFSMPISRRRASLRSQFRQRGLDAHVPQGDPQQKHAPGDMHRVIVASAAAMPPQPFQQLGVGDGARETA